MKKPPSKGSTATHTATIATSSRTQTLRFPVRVCSEAKP